MSRPAEAVHRVIKAYDVRGLVGGEIDESFVGGVGAAFARLMRAEGARRVVVGYDMRDSSPTLAAASGSAEASAPRRSWTRVSKVAPPGAAANVTVSRES